MLTQFHGRPVFGGTFPALLWKAFTQAALAGTTVHDWPAPTPVAGAEVRIDPATGKLRRAELPARALGRDGLREDADARRRTAPAP